MTVSAGMRRGVRQVRNACGSRAVSLDESKRGKEKGGVKMSRVSRIVLAVAIVALVGTGVAMAQSTVTLRGTVLHAEGDNLVVKMDDGSVREFDVQPGFKFAVAFV